MKANEAPEKLYLHPTANGKVGASWLVFPLTNEDIEYIRKDAFIKKTEEYLYKQLNNGNMECGDIETFVEDFKKYMND